MGTSTTTPTLRVVEQLRTKQPTIDPVRNLLRGAVLVTEAAADLPTPLSIRVDDHAVEITLPNRDALNDWSLWLTTPIHAYRVGHVVLYSIRTTVFEVPVVVEWTEVA